MGRPTPRPSHLRISNADRDEALDRLADHYAAGRLDKDEFDERSDAVWTARTGADLAPIFADLQLRAARSPRDVVRSRPGRWRHRPSFPFAPVLVLVIALTVVTSIPFVLLALLGFLLVAGRRGRC
jgi:hypothetical protein